VLSRTSRSGIGATSIFVGVVVVVVVGFASFFLFVCLFFVFFLQV